MRSKPNRKSKPERKIDRIIKRKFSTNSFLHEGWSPDRRSVAVYGTFVTTVPVWQRYRIKRRDGRVQRYWKKTRRMMRTGPVESGRIEFYGKGESLRKAMAKTYHVVPKGFVVVSAEEFLRNPYKYGVEGRWIHREVES